MAGEVRDWLPGAPTMQVADYADSPFFHVNFTVQRLLRKVTPFCDLEVFYNPLFGNMMFIDDEIQISEADFESYHRAMWQAARYFIGVTDIAPRVLVIGDGDGGFTKLRMGAKRIDLVERDRDILDAGEKYFGADWGRVNLYEQSLQEFEPEGRYDVVLLAIDDGFNTGTGVEQELDRIASWIVPGGKLVAQAATDLDPKHPAILSRYRAWAGRNGYAWAKKQAFVRCFFCHENFFVTQVGNSWG